jgi:DNA topoisomerase-1
VEREREIGKFQKKEFWTLDGEFGAEGSTFVAHLISKNGNKYEQTLSFDLFDGKYTTTSSTIPTKEAVDAVISDLKSPYRVSAVDKKEVRRNPSAPYTTSTMQQDAGRRLYFSAKKTMQLAQKLYEEGYITYHRTDSVNLSEKFLTEARDYIVKTYGKEYVPDEARAFHTKSKVAQEAHEAIRPTDVALTHDKLETTAEINRDHHRLYELIWKRAVASQTKEALFDSTTVVITSENAYIFETQGSVIKFDGFLRIMGRDADEAIIPNVTVGEVVSLKKTLPEQHFTNPPPRYTEASLVKALEEKDIGRPSTYAPIISTIQDRQYVIKEEKKLLPTELGNSVTDFLVQYFPNILDLPFTAKLESDLDEIANGQKKWQPVIAEFYGPFEKELAKSYENAEKVKVAVEQLDEKCPDCGNMLVLRMGRYGKFVACSTFPECKYTRQYAEKIDIKCPKCGGDIVVKKSRRGKVFYGCGNYPTCTFAAWKKEDIK